MRAWGIGLLAAAVFLLAVGKARAYGAQDTGTEKPAGAQESEAADSWEEMEAIEEFLKGSGETGGLSFGELMKALAEGNGRRAGQILLQGINSQLLRGLKQGGRTGAQLIAMGMIGAVFAGFSEIFMESRISETGFFMTYLLVFGVLASALFESVRITGEVLQRQTEFMRVLLPAYLLAAAWAGSGQTAAAWYEAALLLIGGVQWLYLKLFTPLVRVYVLLVLAGNIAREEMLSRITGLLGSGLRWGTRSLFGLVLGFQLIQGMVLPYADAVKSAGMQKLLSVIPGIGQGAEAVAKLVLGSGVLVKNSMGAAAVCILAVISLAPLLELALFLFVYRAAAAVLEPVADKRLVGCISGAAEGQKLLLGLAASGMALFALTIALIAMGTNGSSYL